MTPNTPDTRIPTDFQVFVLTPPRHPASTMAIAALRAGGVPLLDLDHGAWKEGCAALAVLASHAEGAPYGVRVAWEDVEAVSGSLPGQLPCLVLGGMQDTHDGVFLEQALSICRLLAVRIYLECWTMHAARLGEACGFDGVVLKGSEAPGETGTTTSYILAQQAHRSLHIPFVIQGGVGLGSVQALALCGACGVVAGEMLWGLAEAPLVSVDRTRWLHADGSESRWFGHGSTGFRLDARLAHGVLEEATWRESQGSDVRQFLRAALREHDGPLPLGQDVAFCGAISRRFGRIGPAVAALKAAAQTRVPSPFGPGQGVAVSHGTRYPIAQGPMTRVSDTAAFAKAVADNGALPFLALALLREAEVRRLLEETRALLGERPWGVGILGFVPAALRQEQLAAIRACGVPWALIAGGRPSQASILEQEGIPTYLHVPSPGLLAQFIRQGARRFVVEGRECGGHVGPRSSFVLWQSAVDVLLEAALEDYSTVHLLLAGGIHDALSAAMAGAITAPLVARGVRVGVLMGTAYLFTEEAVSCGAITASFQQQALSCDSTVLLESGPGHATRAVATPFATEFMAAKQALLKQGKSTEEVRLALEELNVGRLRLAAKGIRRGLALPDGSPSYVVVSPEESLASGMFMIGDVATLRHTVGTLAALHEDVSEGSVRLTSAPNRTVRRRDNHVDEDVAVVGMAGMLPQAEDLHVFWQNIMHRRDCITEVPSARWDPALFYDADPKSPDKTYSKWGGFLRDVVFDPTAYGLTPASITSIEPTFLIALEVARLALDDAGWQAYSFPKARTAAIFGLGGMHDLGMDYVFRTLLAHYLAQVSEVSDEVRQRIQQALLARLPAWTEDSFPGILGNVAAGRIANRLDLGGTNFTVDAACGSSLAALLTGVQQLRLGMCEVALVGAMDGTSNATGFVSFGRTHALSPRGRCRSFDDSADGIAISDGVAAVVLKRLKDAERDGDRIYGVIRGIAASSDGRQRSLTAPALSGQETVLQRAYEDAGLSPSSIELLEAHGTGTKLGDRVEVTALKAVFERHAAMQQACALGSVKSMIGHTKVAAGLAGLIKCLLALQHKVLPATLHVERPNTFVDFKNSPFYVNAEHRPWLRPLDGEPRRAAVSAFGFGGTNFHAIVEEYRREYRSGLTPNWVPLGGEPFVFTASDQQALHHNLLAFQEALADRQDVALTTVAHALWTEGVNGAPVQEGAWRLAFMAASTVELRERLGQAIAALDGSQGVESAIAMGCATTARIAFLYPGQGAQRPHMLRDLLLGSPVAREMVEEAEAVAAGRLGQRLGRFMYPIAAFDDQERAAQKAALDRTEVAQPALAAVEMAATALLAQFGVVPTMAAGHSFGELSALCAAGAFSRRTLFELAVVRGEAAARHVARCGGGMLAVLGAEDQVRSLLASHDALASQLHVANINGPSQVVLGGEVGLLQQAAAFLAEHGLRSKLLPVNGMFHVPEMAEVGAALIAALQGMASHGMRLPVYSNTTARRYPADAEGMADLLRRHVAEPVRFGQMIRQMAADGAEVFVEVGPGQTLSNLVRTNLGERAAVLSLEGHAEAPWIALGNMLCSLYARYGVAVDFDAWFAHRGVPQVSLAAALQGPMPPQHPSLCYRLNPGWARRLDEPDEAVAPRPLPHGARDAQEQRSMPHAAPAEHKSPSSSSAAGRQSGAGPGRDARDAVSKHPASNHRERVGVKAMSELKKEQSGSIWELVQSNLWQLLDLQRGQQRTLERFLDLQLEMLRAASGGVITAEELSATEALAAAAAPAPRPAPAVAPSHVTELVARRKAAAGQVGPAPQVVGLRPQAEPEATPPAVSTPREEKRAEPLRASVPQAAVSQQADDSVEAFQDHLLAAVSKRTGYPKEMLGLDRNMEADLGIDSIKKIEIFSELREHHAVLRVEDEERTLEELSGLRTLGSIIDWYRHNLEKKNHLTSQQQLRTST